MTKRLPSSNTGLGRIVLGRLEDVIFTERRMRFYGSGIAAGYAIAAILSWWGWFPGKWVMHPDGRLGSIDFCWIWAAGKFAVSSTPAMIFDHSALAAAQNLLYRPGECLFLHEFDYPPNFLFFTWPLGLMPYLTAFVVWVTATFALYEAALFAILPRRATLILGAASPAVLKNFQRGHNGYLTAGLIGAALALVERRPWLAGVFVGLLTCKPQFGLLFPVALLASRNWRTLASAAATSVVFSLAAGAVFGWQSWPLFLHSLFDRNTDLSPDPGARFALQSVYGLLHEADANAWIAWTGQLIVTAIVGWAIWTIWASRSIPHALKAASFAIGALLVSPYLLAYDLCILSIAAVFLVEDGLTRGFLPGERTILLVCALALFLPAAPLAAVLCIVLFALIVRRILADPQRAPELAPNLILKRRLPRLTDIPEGRR